MPVNLEVLSYVTNSEGIKVKFRFYLTAREIIGSRELEVTVPSGTLGEALETLRARLGPKASVLFDGDGNLKSHYSVLINGDLIRLPQGLNTKLKSGIVIDLLPPVGGG